MIKNIITPIGDVVACGDDAGLYFLHVADIPPRCSKKIATIRSRIDIFNTPDKTPASILSITKELELYFEGILTEFLTPLHYPEKIYTTFQHITWQALMTIPYGSTITYAEQAKKINHPKAYRAVANANGANPFIIIIPCHRVIGSANSLGGYSAGIERKKFLLEHESKFAQL